MGSTHASLQSVSSESSTFRHRWAKGTIAIKKQVNHFIDVDQVSFIFTVRKSRSIIERFTTFSLAKIVERLRYWKRQHNKPGPLYVDQYVHAMLIGFGLVDAFDEIPPKGQVKIAKEVIEYETDLVLFVR